MLRKRSRLLENAYTIFKNAMNPSWKENSEIRDWHFVRKQAGLIINKSSRVIDRLLKESKFVFKDKYPNKLIHTSFLVFHYCSLVSYMCK